MRKKKVIFLMGPPGAGKGTQAELIADKFGFFHFDSGRYIARIIEESKTGISSKRLQGPPKTKGEKTELEQGLLTDPLWFLGLVKARTSELARAGMSIIFSGSPRTLLEAFGDKKHQGLVPQLIRLYGKKNIYVFKLEVHSKESLKRNSKRMICSLCRKGLLVSKNLRQCPFCGGKLIQRLDDQPAIIKTRLKEYGERTKPVIKELKERGFKITTIDGCPPPAVVFRKISRHLK